MRRDIRLDTLRGVMLVLMMIFHWPGPVRRLTHEPVGFVSAAEGFVFLSGLIAGMVYGRVGLDKGNRTLQQRALRRARDIYLYHVIPLFVVWIVAISITETWEFWGAGIPYVYMKPWTTLVSGMLLLYQPMFFDILPMYVIFVLLMPLIIQQLLLGRRKMVLLGSAGLWVLSQIGIWAWSGELLGHVLPVDLGTFDPFAWQMLFVWGLCLGFWRLTYDGVSIFTRPVPVVMAAGVAGILFLVRYRFIPPGAPVAYDHPLVDISTLAPLRLLNFIVLAYLVGFVAVRFRRLLTWRWLAFLGQHSLQVFTFHLVIVYACMSMFERLESASPAIQVFTTTIAVLSLSIPAWLHQRYREWKLVSSHRPVPAA